MSRTRSVTNCCREGHASMASERRLHPVSFLFAMQDSAKQFLVPGILGLFAVRNLESWEVLAALLILPVAVAAFWRTLSVRYRFDETELVIRSGFLFKRVRHIPYDRIQNVDSVQNPLHRLLGVMEVRVETGGGTDTEANLRVVNRDALEEIRGAVFARRGGTPIGETAEVNAARVLLALSPREVAMFGLIQGYGMLVAGAFFGLLTEVGLLDRAAELFFGERGAGRGVLRRLAAAAFDDAALPIWQLLMTVGTLTVLLVVFRLLSAAWMSATYWGFRLTRSGDDLRCEYGLLTRIASTVPVRRIQKLTVREGPWHRLAGRVSLQVQTAGGRVGEDQQSTRTWLAPLVGRAAIVELVASILPEAALPVEWQSVHPRGVRREFVAMMVIVIPVAVVLVWAIGWRALAGIPFLLVWALIYAQRTVAGLKWGLSADAVHFASGWIWRTVVTAPVTKVQVVSRSESPFDRRHGMASVSADTAGGSGSAIAVPYLAAPVAVALAERLSTAAARTAFRW